jgi:NAD+ dependent glucose-6-phosphate dehydrogenase
MGNACANSSRADPFDGLCGMYTKISPRRIPYLKKTVAITGASGFIGGFLVPGLADSYNVRALTRRAVSPAILGAESFVADLQDLEALQRAFQGVDSVVHMAASASLWASWESVLPNNIVGVYNVYEAALRAGVKQVIFASSNHAVGVYEQDHAPDLYRTGLPRLEHTDPVRPDGYYGVSKCFGEALGRYYADCHGLRIICLRIGYVNREDNPYPSPPYEDPERLASIWLSRRDCLQLVEKSLLADQVKFDIFFGISNNQPHFYDLEHARAVIGYEPQDGAELSKVVLQEVMPHGD